MNLNVAARIRNYIVEQFLFGNDQGLTPSLSLLESGMIDSTGVLELVMFLEESFGIKVRDEDLVPENLDSIDRIDRFVSRKLK